MPDTNTEEDFKLFEDLSFDDVDSCEWMKQCPNETAWLVLCAKCGSGEAVCNQHCIELKETMQKYDFIFTFDRTCGHNVPARKCKIIPKA